MCDVIELPVAVVNLVSVLLTHTFVLEYRIISYFIVSILSSGQWFIVLVVTSNTATIVKTFTFVLILVALPKTVGIVST